ncbi:TPA: hypothetical protein ACT9KI_002700, partial [Legionella pneumophila]
MYEFTLKLHTNQFDEEIANKLFEAGCDDALFSSDSTGVYLDFCRESLSLHDAIISALDDVKRAGYEAEIQEEKNM